MGFPPATTTPLLTQLAPLALAIIYHILHPIFGIRGGACDSVRDSEAVISVRGKFYATRNPVIAPNGVLPFFAPCGAARAAELDPFTG